VGGEQQGEGTLWRVASSGHENPGEQREHWTARRNDWRTGDDEESSQANKTGFTKPQASPVAARHSGTTPESRPHRARCGSNKAANEMSVHTGKRSAPRRKGSEPDGRDN